MSEELVTDESDPEYLEFVLKRKQRQHRALSQQISKLQLRIHHLKKRQEAKEISHE